MRSEEEGSFKLKTYSGKSFASNCESRRAEKDTARLYIYLKVAGVAGEKEM